MYCSLIVQEHQTLFYTVSVHVHKAMVYSMGNRSLQVLLAVNQCKPYQVGLLASD